MQFKPELVERILSGRKTQTRRIFGENDDFSARGGMNMAGLIRTIMPDGKKRLRWEAGRVYAVQPGRGKCAVARVGITAIRVQRLGGISEDDARAEGFPDRAAFLDYWRKLYGQLDLDELVVALTFELVKRQP